MTATGTPYGTIPPSSPQPQRRPVSLPRLAQMRAAGFLANRLFDAVACGARVLSDEVEDLELFGGSVASFTDADDFARLIGDPQRYWPDAERRLANAERVLAEHSFDRRAEQLLAAAIEVHQARGGGRFDPTTRMHARAAA